MKTSKRILSLLLALVMIFTMLPVPTQATGTKPQTSVDTGDVTVEGTNGFGNLLSQEIKESQDESASVEEDYEAGYSVIDLTFEGATATVEYSSLEEARLVVAVYSEDGLQMLASGETTVSPEEDLATVTIEGDMPEYFMASAYLMDTYDMSPLCAAYDTPMYTQEMQELLESTVDDYDPERVLNLDEDKTTNFAVYAEDTIVIEPTDGVNTVRSVDDENATYVIENADEYITSLTAGDVFIYPYGKQEILIVKVGTIIIDGTTVTITGSELEIEEAFSYLKIETQSGMDEVIVDDSNLPEGLIYEGITGDDAGGITPHVDGEVSGKKHMDFTFEAFKDEETGTELNGTFDFTVKASVEYYLTRSYQRIEIKVSPAFSLEVEFKVTLSSDPIEVPILPIKMPFLFGAATIDFTPKLVGEFEVSITLTIAKVEATIGFYFDHGKNGTKFKPIYASSFESFNIEAEGTFFIGLKLEPALEILGGAAAYAKISGEIGVYISAKYDPRSNASNQDVIHTCDSCWDGDVSLGIKTGAKLSVFSISKLSNSISFFDYKWKFADFYISYGNGGFGMGECPNHDYRITVYVTDSEGAPITGAEVTAYDGQMGITDDNGIAVFYLHRWAYFCHSIVARYGEKESWVNFVPDKAQKLYMTLSEDGESKNIFDSIIPDDYIDETKYIASGKCGDKVHWTLSADGILSIAGKGAMYYTTPWYNYCDNISSVIIGNGVTTIMSSAFSGCSGLTSVSIPNSVTAIGSSAFEDCTSLTSVKIPDRVTEIGNRTFMGCTNLTSIEPPNSMTTIGEYAFYNCTSLTSVAIPDGVTTIGEYAFCNCTCLTSLEVPDGVTAIGNGAFENCTKLATVNIPDSVTTIAQDTFNGCIKLTSVEIPHSVTTIGASAFAGCDSLTTVKIPYGLTTIGSSAFEGCTSVKSAKFPNSVTMIGDHAFFGCTGLITVEIPSSITTIAAWTFAGCGSLTSVNIPNSVTTIEEYAFWECDSLTTVEIPNSVTAMGEAVFKNCDSLTTVEIPDSVTIIAAWNFSGCDSLTSVNIPSSVTIIAGQAFSHCDSLTSVDIPDSVTIIGADAFSSCGSLISVSIPDSVTTIEEYAFWACDSLVAIEIPSSVTTIGDAAFYADISLVEIVFYGDAPSIGEEVFAHVPATAYYPAGNSTWTYEVREAFCGYITWVPYTLDENGDMITNAAAAVTTVAELADIDVPDARDEVPVMQTSLEVPAPDFGARDEPLNPNAVYDGEYSTVVTDAYTLKTASFSGLVPGEQYVLLAMVSIDVEDPLAADNLLYIDQAAALEDGTLVFQYVQRTPTETSYVVACGASNKDLNDAEITFPEMVADGETLIVNPTVVYDGQTLIEGQDYTIQGTVSVTEPGTYTCYIRGVRNYTGLVECTYTVALVLGVEVASGTCGVNVAWSLYDKGTLLISGTGPMEDYNGAAYTPWYDSRSSILRIIIEEGVTTISEYAFCDCGNMTSMTIPDDVMTIGDCAFSYCEKLTNATIPNSVTSIGEYAFSHCESLTDVSMGNGVISIGYGAFQECSNLASLRIPDSVTSIGKYAFSNCESLTDVSMGNGVSTIGDYVFSGCCDLTSIRLPEGVKSIGRDAFEYCYSLTSVEIPESVTDIGERAFAYCERLTHVEIPHGITAIAEETFSGCHNLTSVTIPDSVTSIGRSAFANCHSLASVKIPNGVTSIGEEAFFYCENMATVIIGHSVATIYSNAFDCCGVKEIRFWGSCPWIYSKAFRGVTATAYYLADDETWADDAVRQGYGGTITWVPYNHEYASVDIAPTCSKQGYTLHTCSVCDYSHMSDFVSALGHSYQDHVCTRCGEHIPEIQLDTESNAVIFNGGGIAYFSFTPDVTAQYTFYSNCNRDTYGYIYDAGLNELAYNDDGDSGTNFAVTQTLEEGVTYILGARFYDSELTGEIPASIIMGTDVPIKGTCGKNVVWKLRNNGTLTISGSGPMTNYAYYTDVPWYKYLRNIQTVVIEDGVTSIGSYAYYYHTSLTSVTISDSVTSIGKYAFYECESLTNLTMGNSVTIIGDRAFTKCSNLPNVRLADSVTSIGQYAFYDCKSLTDVVMGNSVISIGDSAFMRCSSLTSVRIPDSVTSISRHAFGSCLGLREIYFTGNAPSFGVSVFYEVSATAHYPADNDTWTKDVMQDYGGTITWVAYTPVCINHNYEAVVTIPTCTEGGYTTYTCSVCGDSYQEDFIKALGHDMGTWAAVKEATCTDNGTNRRDCSRCDHYEIHTVVATGHSFRAWFVNRAATCTEDGENRRNCTKCSHYETEDIPAIGHDYESVVTAPTCTEQGYTTHTCACGHSYKDSYTPATGHSYSYKVTKAPTASTAGTLTGTCAKCSDTTAVTLPRLNTTDYSYKVDKEATCTAAGTGRYTWKTTTYGSFYFDVSIAAKGHSYTVSVTHPTCTEKGYTTYSCHCGDRYVSDYTDPLGHDMGKWTAINEATCTRNGLEIRECSRCDHSETRTIDALGHDWDDGVVTIEPTEKEEGEMTYTCERCGNTRTEPIPNLEHEHRYDAVVTAPTCTEQGFTTHTCRCGDSYIDSYTSRLGHSFTTYVSDNNATCTQDGTKTAICDRCDLTNTVTDEGSATDHHYGRVVIAPTCTELGYTTYTCECGESYTADYVDALGHDFTDWVVIQEPTDEEVGLEIRTCTRCGHEEQRGVTKPENPDLIASGVCGIDLMWMLSSDGCLTISGTGEMFDFGSFDSPWFDYKEEILRVVIEDGTTSIGDYAFNYCANVTTIQIPDSVTVIGQSAFDDCRSLPELNLPNNLVSIGSYAFYDCSSLSSIVIPASVTSIGDNAFWDCLSLEEIVVASANQEYSTRDGVLYNKQQTTLLVYPTGKAGAFVIPNSVSAIRDFAFYNAEKMSSVMIPNHVTYIGYASFWGCKELHTVKIPGGITNIPSHAFTFCTSLSQMTIPSNITLIEDSAFAYCENLTLITFEGDAPLFEEDVFLRVAADASYPANNTTWTADVMQDYGGMITWISYGQEKLPFTDVSEGSFFYEPVAWAVENGITNGTSATTFGPNDQCMRAHVVTFLWRAVGSPEPTRTDNPFVDVKPTDFYYKPVLWAVENGITSGMDATHFGPTAYCNRAQVVTFLYRTMGSPDVGAATNPFTDVAAGSFYEKPVLWAVENGVTAGLSATSFGPNSICNRAQIVTFLYRAFVND